MNLSSAPTHLVFVDSGREEIVNEQILELRILSECFLDVSKKRRTNDAAAAPQQRYRAHVEIPVAFFVGGSKQHVALRIADDLRAVEGSAYVFHEIRLLLGRDIDVLRTAQRRRDPHAFLLQRQKTSLEAGDVADRPERGARFPRASRPPRVA